jgi:hypothetical protein
MSDDVENLKFTPRVGMQTCSSSIAIVLVYWCSTQMAQRQHLVRQRTVGPTQPVLGLSREVS